MICATCKDERSVMMKKKINGGDDDEDGHDDDKYCKMGNCKNKQMHLDDNDKNIRS